ncbi:hypothetical protein B0181_08115 [Moraxella caviae]|uniref:Uncharacterized protein n=1 Tax=Moraxella caviae TaxID=34060 RepID=A0A1S9ZYG9_9GAMM|nr:hypothetical protein B0181_08115 [Moraxella caviae]
MVQLANTTLQNLTNFHKIEKNTSRFDENHWYFFVQLYIIGEIYIKASNHEKDDLTSVITALSFLFGACFFVVKF